MKFSPQGKILILRYSRLGRTPSALYSAELLANSGIEVLAFEYGLPQEPIEQIDGPVPRLRYAWPQRNFLMQVLQPSRRV